jgi:hypothetical protein
VLPALAAIVATLALVASVTLTPPAPPAPGERDASALAQVEHATPPTLHTARAPRGASLAASVDLPPPPPILAAPRAWTLQRRAGDAHARVVRERDLRSQAPRAPPPRRS